MNNLFKLLVYLKQPRDKEAVLHPIYIRITVDGKRAEISTKRESEPGKWNKKAGRMVGTNENASQLNAFLDRLVVKVSNSGVDFAKKLTLDLSASVRVTP